MASESSTKQDEEATTEEVPESIAIYTEKEINTVNRHVTLSVLSLGHFISICLYLEVELLNDVALRSFCVLRHL